jgi:hypothetical protein
MNQTGHRSVQIVRRFIQDGSLFRENSAGKLGPYSQKSVDLSTARIQDQSGRMEKPISSSVEQVIPRSKNGRVPLPTLPRC